MVSTWPRIVIWLPRNAGKVGSLHAHVDVHHRQQVVARYHGEAAAGPGGGEVAQQLRRAGGVAAGGDRNVEQGVERVDLVLRRLDRDVVHHAVLRIEPERRRGLRTAG
jgi:hypothetical protein